MAADLLHLFKKNLANLVGEYRGFEFLITVSGGVDSMAMAHLFAQAGISISVAHCNFQLRGADSDQDEALVRHWCDQRSIRCFVKKFDTADESVRLKKGIQETARVLRYEWFDSLRLQHKLFAIATAHHANDNVETLLINLSRGTGIAGIHGILPFQNHICRPLLFATRKMIADYATENSVPFREDASNQTNDYLRNALRHRIVPVLEELQPGALTNIAESISRFAEAEILYRQSVNLHLKKLLEQRGRDTYIPVLKLRKIPAYKTVLFEILYPLGFNSAQVAQVATLLDAATGHFVASPSHRVIRDRDFLIITESADHQSDMVLVSSVPCRVATSDSELIFEIKNTSSDFVVGKNTACLDISKVVFPIIVRTVRQGDYLYPFGMGMKKKKVSRLLIDEKVPLHQKEKIRIIESGKRIAWVAGFRADERFRVPPGTDKMLVITVRQLVNG